MKEESHSSCGGGQVPIPEKKAEGTAVGCVEGCYNWYVDSLLFYGKVT